jgi:hypothetical protein
VDVITSVLAFLKGRLNRSEVARPKAIISRTSVLGNNQAHHIKVVNLASKFATCKHKVQALKFQGVSLKEDSERGFREKQGER